MLIGLNISVKKQKSSEKTDKKKKVRPNCMWSIRN